VSVPKLRVVGSIPIARSNASKDLDGIEQGTLCAVSAECPRNTFTGRSSGEPVAIPKNRVCRPASTSGHAGISAHVSPPAHPLNRLIAQLNNNWRVVDHPLQWILQRRKGKPRKKNSGWRDRSFCTTREVLLRSIREYCGKVDQNALVDLQALPDHHADVEQPK
jgi:hypothetical protein